MKENLEKITEETIKSERFTRQDYLEAGKILGIGLGYAGIIALCGYFGHAIQEEYFHYTGNPLLGHGTIVGACVGGFFCNGVQEGLSR